MALKLDLGSIGTVDLASTGDLAKRLQPGIDTLVQFDPQLLNFPATQISNLPAGSLSSDFNFTVGPTWQLNQTVGITLSVKPEAACSVALVKPGGELFRLNVADDETPVIAGNGSYYLAVALQCGLAVDSGAQWSNGNLGVSGDVSTGARFRIANYCQVPESATLGDALAQAFSAFVLPFQAESVAAMPDGNYIDCDFIGKLALGFGATYGFSGLFLAGRSNGEVAASFDSLIGKGVAPLQPSFQVGAGFKLEYDHRGAFRVIAGRNKDTAQDGAVLYLLRGDTQAISATESLGITLGAGAKFQTDASTLAGEIQQAAAAAFPGAAGAKLGASLSASADSIVSSVNAGVNALLAKADGQKMTLETVQSRSAENAALFIYRFDFRKGGLAAYDCAMRGDYARAVRMPGVTLDPRSLVERLYVQSAGLNLQLFGALQYHDIEDYIQRTDVSYAGDRAFDVRDTLGLKAVSGLFGKEREADLYFIAESSQATSVSGLDVRLHAIFQEQNNSEASAETSRMLAALRQTPPNTPRVTLDADAAKFAGLTQDAAAAYEAFARAVRDIIGTDNGSAAIFLANFARYADWLEFDRATDGNPNGDRWPEDYPPSDRGLRLQVQTYILSGRHFVDFCAGLKELAASIPGVADEKQYERLLTAIDGMVHRDFAFPTYFLKPAMVAVFRLAGVAPEISQPAASV